jgi:predicted nucleic acid-binding protein
MRIERVFLDTNVLLEATDQGRRFHAQATGLLHDFAKRQWSLHCTAQVLREYLVVATRPESANGLGLSVPDAVANIRQFRKKVALVLEPQVCLDTLLTWSEHHGTTGRKLHDLQILVAAYHGGMNTLLTANTKDFPVIKEIAILPLESL